MLIFSCPKAVGFEQGPHSCNQLMKIEMIPAKKSKQTFNVADCLPSRGFKNAVFVIHNGLKSDIYYLINQ